MISSYDDKTAISRNAGFAMTSENKSNKSRALSVSRNAPAVKTFLDKVGITSDNDLRQSTTRALAHQASEANFVKTPLRMAFSGREHRPITSKNTGRNKAPRIMSSFGR